MIPKPSEATRSAITWYKTARAAGEIPFWIIFVIAIGTPFEEFILKWLPSAAASILRFLPEVVLYGLMLQVLGRKFINRKGLKATPIDTLLALFFVATAVSMVVNGSGIFPSLTNLRSLWRYLSIFYVLVNINISIPQLRLTIKGLRIAGFVEASIATLQFFLPSGFSNIFAPQQVQIGDYERVAQAESGEIKVGSVFGTFATPAVLSAFLLFIMVVSGTCFFMTPGLLSDRLKGLTEIGVVFMGLFATKKRASWVLAALVPIAVLYFQRRAKGLAKMIWLYVALIFGLFLITAFLGSNFDTSFAGPEARERSIDVGSYLLQIFSPDYWEKSAENSRGWVVKTVVGAILQSGSWFGFGPDIDNVRELIFNLLTDGSDRAKILDLDPVEDTYWIAMLAYYGFVGVGIYLFIMARLFQAGRWLATRSSNIDHRRLGTMFCTLVVMTVLYACVERVFKFRAFSLYFWLLAGFVVNIRNKYQQQAIDSP